MFSTRTPTSFAPNRLTERLEALRSCLNDLLDLTGSNPTRAGFEYPSFVLEALTDPASLVYAADPRGILTARQAIAHYYRQREGLEVPVERILLTASTSEAYTFLLKLLADPGDTVLVPAPSYPLFDHLLALENVRPLPYPLRYDGHWHIDPGALQRLVQTNTRAIVIVNPNNPTGAFLKRDELTLLTDLCREHNLALISDEVFADYGYGADADRIETVAAHPDVLSFSLSGLSKVLGLPQMKLGWILVNGPRPILNEALERLEFITDTFLSVATPIQQALPRLLEARGHLQGQIRARIDRNRARALDRIAGMAALTPLHAEGGWYLTLRVARVRSEEQLVLELLEHDHVLVHPGFFFDFASEAYLVVSLLTRPEVFDEGLERLCVRAASWLGEDDR